MDENKVSQYSDLLRFINQAESAEELVAHIKAAGGKDPKALSEEIMSHKSEAGGALLGDAMLTSISGIDRGLLMRLTEVAAKALTPPVVEAERHQFMAKLVQNPNYFGNLEVSKFNPVLKKIGDTTYEEVTCVGLQPAFDRLEATIQIKKPSGYSGGMCDPGSREYVRFYVDLHDNGVLHDVGMASVRVHDIPGVKPICYAVYLDFESIRKLCLSENIVRVRAILSWNVPPPANTPNFAPVWGNRLDVQVQIRPRRLIIFSDFLNELEIAKVKIPQAAQPLVAAIEPTSELQTISEMSLSIDQKRRAYKSEVPVHRFAFPEVHQLLMSPGAAGEYLLSDQSALSKLGLQAVEFDDLLGKIFNTDGDTSFEELKCVGLYPEADMIEAVLTVKKNSGYSGSLCQAGSTEFVAFWMDFGDGAGFTYMGTSTVIVHDLQQIGAAGIQYAVFLKTNLAKRLVPCFAGARVVRLRAILSWETAPPPNNPNFIPVWGNREECRVQLRPGFGTGHIPLIETIGDVGVDDINQANGLATGNMVIAAASVNQSPFGLGVTITGRIGNPPDSFGGGAAPFKYKIEVAPDGTNDWQPLTNKITVKKSEFINGFPVPCAPGDFVCDVVLTPTDDGDGHGPGWYPYIEDLSAPAQRFLVVDVLGRWDTNANMEGLWKIRITAKNPATSPPQIFNGVQVVKVRIDNTAPTASIAITGATLNGQPVPAVDCGKFKVGTVLSGTFSVHDPGATSPAAAFQHYGGSSIVVTPSLPGNAPVTTIPVSLNFPAIGTTGVDGTWELNTAGMQPCGYVLRLTGCDRTNVNSSGVSFCTVDDVGFCLE